MKNITYIITLAVMVFVAGCTTGTHQVTGTLRPPVPPEAVMIYHQMPDHAQVVGTITADSYGGLTLTDANGDALQKLRTEAGRMGANGVVLNATNDQPMDGAQMLAKAVYVQR